MEVNSMDISSLQKISSTNVEKEFIRTLAEKDQTDHSRKDRDVFIRSSEDAYSGTYHTNAGKKTKYLSAEILALVNGEINGQHTIGDVHYLKNGMSFTSDQIPPINTCKLEEVKAENNCMDFGRNRYFKYVSKDGKEHPLYTNEEGIGSLYSEYLRGAPYDGTLQRYARFWMYVGTAREDLVYIGETFPKSEIKSYLEEAGIQPGFFTIKMGDTETTRFYSTGENTGYLFTKKHYDEKYDSLTKTGELLYKHKPGSVFKFQGKEYVLSENHTLDIPYGVDIFSNEGMEYPSLEEN
ncbi:MAG: hypothetical protein IJ716_04235 [Lachnospiraceae bacterium]|nr:hypothetical protein [Lachnospiraceae bacterium]